MIEIKLRPGAAYRLSIINSSSAARKPADKSAIGTDTSSISTGTIIRPFTTRRWCRRCRAALLRDRSAWRLIFGLRLFRLEPDRDRPQAITTPENLEPAAQRAIRRNPSSRPQVDDKNGRRAVERAHSFQYSRLRTARSRRSVLSRTLARPVLTPCCPY